MQLCINMQSHEYEGIHECYCTMNKLASYKTKYTRTQTRARGLYM